MSTGVLSWGKSGPGMKLTNQLHPVQKLRMTEAKPLLPLHTFMVQTSDFFKFFNLFYIET